LAFLNRREPKFFVLTPPLPLRKKLWFNAPGVAPTTKQLAFWLGAACVFGFIPFIVISCVTLFKDSEALPKEVHLFQLCWYYGCILLTPIILYRVDAHFKEFFRYIVLGKESVSDPKVYECGLRNLRFWNKGRDSVGGYSVANFRDI